MKYFCNPLNVNYRYQFNADPRQHGSLQICREAADPSMILFKNRYYIFASMTLGVWVSDDLTNWENHRLPESLPLYDYAPDVRVLGEWVYFCASNREHNCDRWRTKDVIQHRHTFSRRMLGRKTEFFQIIAERLRHIVLGKHHVKMIVRRRVGHIAAGQENPAQIGNTALRTQTALMRHCTPPTVIRQREAFADDSSLRTGQNDLIAFAALLRIVRISIVTDNGKQLTFIGKACGADVAEAFDQHTNRQGSCLTAARSKADLAVGEQIRRPQNSKQKCRLTAHFFQFDIA